MKKSTGFADMDLMLSIFAILTLLVVAMPTLSPEYHESVACMEEMIRAVGQASTSETSQKQDIIQCQDNSDHFFANPRFLWQNGSWVFTQDLPAAQLREKEFTTSKDATSIEEKKDVLIIRTAKRWWSRFIFGTILFLVAAVIMFYNCILLYENAKTYWPRIILNLIAFIFLLVPLFAGINWIAGTNRVEILPQTKKVVIQRDWFGQSILHPKHIDKPELVFLARNEEQKTVDVYLMYKEQELILSYRICALPQNNIPEAAYIVNFSNYSPLLKKK